MNRLIATCLTIAVMATPVLAGAQQERRTDPADPKISVPPANYASPLQQYRPLADEPVAPWKTSNDVVEKIGGWRVYAKEVQEAAPDSAPTVRPVQPPAPQAYPPAQGGHSGHHMK